MTRSPQSAPSASQLIRFAAIAVPIYAAAQPVAAYLPAIMAKDFGLSLGTLGLLMLVGQIINSVLDPVIGTLSDHTRARFGRRRTWIAAGGLTFTAGAVLLFFPPPGGSIVWLATGLLLFYAGTSAVQTPLLAWSGELSSDYHQRTRITAYTTVLVAVALVVTLAVAAVGDRLFQGDGRIRLALFGALVLVTALPSLWLTLTAAPDRPAELMARAPFSLRTTLGAVFGNGLLVRVILSDAAVRTGQGIRGVLLVFYVTYYLRRPEWAAGLFLFQYIFGMAAGPIWLRISLRLGKNRTAVLAELVQAAINAGLLLTTPDRFGLVLFLAFAQGLAQGSGNIMLRSMVADIADKHRAETGEDRVGLYYSVFSVSEKLGGALAVGLALPLVAALGFDPKSTANTPQSLNGLLLVFALGPSIAHAVSAALVAGFPLDGKRHSEIRRQLEARDRTSAASLVPAE